MAKIQRRSVSVDAVGESSPGEVGMEEHQLRLRGGSGDRSSVEEWVSTSERANLEIGGAGTEGEEPVGTQGRLRDDVIAMSVVRGVEIRGQDWQFLGGDVGE